MKKILIIRLSSMGDIIMAMGILPCIKKRFPGATIHWMIQSEFKELLINNYLIDKTIIWDRKEWGLLLKEHKGISLIEEMFSMIHAIREDYYDMVLDLQGIWKSAIWTILTKATKKLVVDPKENTHLLFQERIFSCPGDKRLGSEYKQVLTYLGADIQDYHLTLTGNSAITEGISALLKKRGIAHNYIVLCPFTTREQKHWIDEYWSNLIEMLFYLNIPIIVLGGPQDRDRYLSIFSPTKEKITSLVGKTRIIEALEIIRRACAVIGVDTGLTHAAMLYHVPTVAIFGATCPYLYPDHDYGIVLYSGLKCSPCKRTPTCGGEFTCMRKITPQRVFQSLESILSLSV